MTVTATSIIWEQISRETKLSIGAREPVADGNAYLHFQYGRSHGGSFRKIVIRLNGNDLYDVEFIRFDGKTYEMTTERAIQDVYSENLSATIYANAITR